MSASWNIQSDFDNDSVVDFIFIKNSSLESILGTKMVHFGMKIHI